MKKTSNSSNDLIFVGRLIETNDIVNPEKPLEKVKKISFQVLKMDEGSYEKLTNLCNQYANRVLPIYHIPFEEGKEGYQVTVRLSSIRQKFGPEMLEVSRDKWVNQMFLIQTKIKNYQFKSKLEFNLGEMIYGSNFMLEYMDLL